MIRKKLVLFAVFCIVVGAFVFGCATGKKVYVAGEEEEIYGIWSNPGYKGEMFIDLPMMEFQPIPEIPSGKCLRYKTETGQTGAYEYNYQIHEKWTDKKGDVWYKLTVEYRPTSTYQFALCRISNSGRTIEMCLDNKDYPPEIDPNSRLYDYYVYYRE